MGNLYVSNHEPIARSWHCCGIYIWYSLTLLEDNAWSPACKTDVSAPSIVMIKTDFSAAHFQSSHSFVHNQ